MAKKKISLVLIIIIISTVLILGGTLTWGFLTEWGQKNKSSAPTEIEVDGEFPMCGHSLLSFRPFERLPW